MTNGLFVIVYLIAGISRMDSCFSASRSSRQPKTGIIPDINTITATPTDTQNAPAPRSGNMSAAANRNSHPAATDAMRPIYIRQTITRVRSS